MCAICVMLTLVVLYNLLFFGFASVFVKLILLTGKLIRVLQIFGCGGRFCSRCRGHWLKRRPGNKCMLMPSFDE